MSKTAEELYEERLEDAVHLLVVEFLERGLEFLDSAEALEDSFDEFDPDFHKDAHERATDEIDTILQRWLDRDN